MKTLLLMTMPFNRLIAILIVLGLLLLPQLIHAQDPSTELPNTYITHDGSFSFQFPQDWFLAVEGDQGEFIFVSDIDFDEMFSIDPETQLSFISVAPPGGLLTAFPFIGEIPETPRELLELIIAGLDDGTSTMTMEIEEVTLNDRPAVIANVEEGGSQGQIFIIDFGNGEMAMLTATTYNIEYASQQETVMAMAASMTLHEYETGDFRLVTSPDNNIAFDMPAEFIYDDTQQEFAILFGSNQSVIDTSLPAEGDLVGVISSLEQWEEGGITIDSPEQIIAIFGDSVVSDEADGVSFGDIEYLTFEDRPVTEIVQFRFNSESSDRVLLVFELSDGRMMAAIFGTYRDEYADFEDTIMQIATSVKPFSTPTSDTDTDIESSDG